MTDVPAAAETVIADLLARLEDGELDLDQACQKHPDLAPMLLRCWSMLRASLQGTPPSPESAGATKLNQQAPIDPSRYREAGEIGRGGMGVVSAVRDESLGRTIALKRVRHESEPVVLERFLEEAQITAQLTHPGVVPLHDLCLDEQGRPGFTMQLVDGMTADRMFELARSGLNGWTLTRALEAMTRVCDTMAFAHSKGVVHRDLKPANVMIGQFGEVYVMDWGLARVVESGAEEHHVRTDRREGSDESSMLTGDGSLIGTLHYMPPEQAAGHIDAIDEQSDVYSLGAMLYELLSGEPPHAELANDADWESRRRRVKDTAPKSLHRIEHPAPGELVAITERAMARRKEDRYASMAAVADDLRAFLDRRVVRAYRTGPVAEISMWVRRNRAFAASVAAVFVISIASAIGLYVLEGRARENARVAGIEKERAIDKQRRFDLLALRDQLETAKTMAKGLNRSWPEDAEDLHEWLDDHATPLIDAIPTMRATIATMHEEVGPFDEATREQQREAKRAFPTLARRRLQVAHEQLAQRVREGKAKPESFELPPLDPPWEELDLKAREALLGKWLRTVDQLATPHKKVFGREAEGLAIARRALELSWPGPARAAAQSRLAWACVEFGLDDEAVELITAAIDEADSRRKRMTQTELERIRTHIADRRSSDYAEHVQRGVNNIEDLEAILVDWEFETPGDRTLHNALALTLAGAKEVRDRLKKELVARLEWAEQIDDLTRNHPNAPTTWDQAIESIRNGDGQSAHVAYRGLEIGVQLGLIPIGMNPVTKLWEFYHLRSGWHPTYHGAQGLSPGGLPVPSVKDYDAQGRVKAGNETGIVFVLIPPSDQQAAFFMSRHELTKTQYQFLTVGRDPSRHLFRTEPPGNPAAIGLRHPVERVSWTDGDSALTRFRLRLPTEAEWEHACRAGSNDTWSFGSDSSAFVRYGNVLDQQGGKHLSNVFGNVAPWNDRYAVHAPVGTFLPNAFGLHDMHGNVWEWCANAFNPADDSSVPDRPLRGGSFEMSAEAASSKTRVSRQPSWTDHSVGLRAARSIF